MSFGNCGILKTMNIASNTTLSSAFTVPVALQEIGLFIPSMASGCDVYLQGSADGTTYKRLRWSAAGTGAGTSTPAARFVDSSITLCLVPFGRPGVPYLKIELSTAMTATSANIVVYGSH